MSGFTLGHFTAEQSAAAHRQRRERKTKPAQPLPPMYVRPYPPYLPGHTDPAWGVAIAGRDLRVGDQLVYIHASLGTHTIDRLVPYDGGLQLGSGARTAYSGTWGITVAPDATVRILPREAA